VSGHQAHGVPQRRSVGWLLPEDSADATPIAGIQRATAFHWNPEVAAGEHLSLARMGGPV
jgi:hypothetical protein